MSIDVPASLLTTHELAKLAGFDRSLGNSIDAALAATSPAVLVDNSTIAGDGVATPLHVISTAGATSLPVINVKSSPYNAVGDGVTDDRAAIQAAMQAAATAGGGIVHFPPGTYIVGQSGTNAWCLDMPGSNITLMGVKGSSIIKAKAGMPASSVAVLRINTVSNITLSGVTIDGNWGNAWTIVAATSHNVALPTATINVFSTAGFPTAGSFTLVLPTGTQTISYTGVTATSFTGCTGGTGTLIYEAQIGYTDSQTGLNHSTQADPKNYGVMLRGCENVLIDNCVVQDTYGDGIWIGYSATDQNVGARNVTIRHTKINLTARDGFAFGSKAERIRIRDCECWAIYTQALDFEPVDTPVVDVVIEGSFFDNWWNPSNVSRNINAPVSLSGGRGASVSDMYSTLRNIRFVNNRVRGAVLIIDVHDLQVKGNRIDLDWTGNAYHPIQVYGYCDDVWVEDNTVYDRTTFAGGTPHNLVTVSCEPVGGLNLQPVGVHVRRNKLYARNGNSGIQVNGSGGQDFNGTRQTSVTGTATGVTASTLTDSGAAWTTNQYEGMRVRVGNLQGNITGNTATQLSIYGWRYPQGQLAPTPAAGTYVIEAGGGIISIEDNYIDCSNDGWGHGGNGIQIAANYAGMRVLCERNHVRNAQGDAIVVTSQYRFIDELRIVENRAWDNQATPTATNTVNFSGPQNITSLIMRGNVKGPGLTGAAVAGIAATAGNYWLEHDGIAPRYVGYGLPEGVVTANIGAQYVRLEGGVGRTLYVKEQNSGFSTGWARCDRPPAPGWTVDDGSGRACPATNTEWTNLITAAGLNGVVAVPDMYWGFQEASGSVVDLSGNGYALTATGVSYSQTLLGWARKAVVIAENTGNNLQNTSATLPDMSVGAMTLVLFGTVEEVTPNAVRSLGLLGAGAALTNYSYVGGGTATRVVSGANAATAAGTEYLTPRPYWLIHDHAGTSTVGGEDLNKLTPTFAAGVTGKGVTIGGVGGLIGAAGTHMFYGFAWKSNIGTANLKTLLKMMGWDIAWT